MAGIAGIIAAGNEKGRLVGNLEGKIALVSGGASGMGLASARALAQEGASVVISDRDGAAAERAAAAIRESGGSAKPFKADVSSLAELRAMIDFVRDTHGRLNVFFSNAGIGGARGFDVSEEAFDEAFDVNLKSHFFATSYALPLLKTAAPKASVIFTSSVRGLRASGDTPLYCMSKAAIVMMARCMALQFAESGVRVNTICPGAVDTDFPRNWMGLSEEQHQAMRKNSVAKIPLKRIGQPEDVASLVCFLASDQSSFLTGTAIPIDGGGTA